MACRQRIVSGDDGLGRDVRGGCDETFSVLAATKIPVGEFAVRQYGEISLTATVTPTVRHLVVINGRQPAGRTPKLPVSHDAVAALFHSTRICTTFPAFTPVTLPYWQVISVWVTECY